MSQKEGYINFEEYSQVGEPQKAERAYAWSTAIGLQAVDGLTVSQYLKDTAVRNIEGEITIDEARELIKTYYQTKTSREPDDEEKQEADKVSGNTRTTAVFTIKYLRSIGFDVTIEHLAPSGGCQPPRLPGELPRGTSEMRLYVPITKI